MSEKVSDRLRLGHGRLLIRTGKVEIGQRIRTALAVIVHEELSLPFDQIAVLPVSTADGLDEGITSGSNSIEQSGIALQRAAATLRAHLLAGAAAEFGGDPADWTLADGMIRGPGTNQLLPVLDRIALTGLEIPVDMRARAHTAPRSSGPCMLELTDIVAGRHVFVHDLDLPGMLHARVVHPPHANARLRDIDEGVLRNLTEEGFRIHRDGSFLAVAGAGEWPVNRAAARLSRAVSWDRGAGLDETDIFSRLLPENAIRLPVRDGTPRPEEPIPPDIENPAYSARYERPFTLHGSLAPSAALAEWDGRTLSITCHSQGIFVLRDSIAESLGLDPDNVVITHAPGSGCYGHNGADDVAFEAALIALANPGVPILLKWNRGDEHCWEPVGPAMATELAATIGVDGRIDSMSVEAIGGTFRGRPRPGPGHAGPARLLANRFRSRPIGPATPAPNLNRQGGLQRNLDPVYEIRRTRFVKNLVPDMPLRTSALRCLGAALNVFAIESFIDEVAHGEGRDPLSFRRDHLRDARALAVLDRLEVEAAALPPAGGHGIAYAQYKNAMTRVGVAVALDVDDAAVIRLRRAVIVADAGRIIDRDGLSAQLEGGFLQAASWALHEEVRWDRDGALSRDWDSYPVLRFDEVPEISVILLDRPEEKPVGAGEASPGPGLAAIGNAVFAATGVRMRRLPMTPENLTRAALST